MKTMALFLTATLYESTVVELLAQFLPLRLHLDEKKRRWVESDPPHHVKFVPNVGLRLRTSARVQWTVAGVPLMVTIRVVQILIRPEIVHSPKGGKLAFRIFVEDADLKGLPTAIDQTIVQRINEKLLALGDRIAWDYGETLRRSIRMPAAIAPVEAFQMRAQEGSVEITDDSLRFSLYTPARFRRSGQEEG
jgi:hypothetical protein